MSEAANLLEAVDVRVRRGRDDVLHGVSLSVAAGEVVAVLGPNGAGKSTLLDALGGGLKPASGVVHREGRVATVMQSPGLARRSVRTNVELALAWWGVPRRERRPRALDALTQMRADHLAKRPATALSGGERRRVHLARAVAIRPDILLLDEPFVGLDPTSHAALCEDTSSALRMTSSAVVMVVHDRAEAWAMADRILVMFGGRIVAEGRPHEVLERPPTAEVARFLGYDGELADGDEVLLTRPSNVRLDPHGDLTATVTRVIPVEDGARVELQTPRGLLKAFVASPDVRKGDAVRVRVVGGVRFLRG
jgi:ABC-type nitrate/sulfonate/bicarbonate transport system ATPase subunit